VIVAGTPAPEDFDYFHEMILYDELSRCGNAAGEFLYTLSFHTPDTYSDRSHCRSYQWTRYRYQRFVAIRKQAPESMLLACYQSARSFRKSAGVSPQLLCCLQCLSQDKYLKDVLMGRSFCALAISEPAAGSDVAGQSQFIFGAGFWLWFLCLLHLESP
jgi:hypothetical protein